MASATAWRRAISSRKVSLAENCRRSNLFLTGPMPRCSSRRPHAAYNPEHSPRRGRPRGSSRTRRYAQRRHRPRSTASIPSSTTNTMPLSSGRAGRVCELRLAWLKQASTRRAYRSCSPREVTLSRHRAASMPPWATCTRTTGGGTCMTRSRARIGWVTKMRFIT
jgi:hypothetical protein